MGDYYNKAALEKLSSPEKLDQMITIVGTKGWISLAMFSIAIITLILWGFMGTIKTKVNGSGMLLGGAVHDIVPVSSGQIKAIYIEPGDEVKKGDIIANIYQPDLEQQIEETLSKRKELEIQHLQLTKFGSQDIKIQEDFLSQQKLTLKQTLETNKKNINFLVKQLSVEKGLLEKGLITKGQYINTEQRLDKARGQLEQNKTNLKQLSSQELNTEYNLEQRILASRQRINEVERSIEQLKDRKDLYSLVRSPYNGKILEVMSDRGAVISVGRPIAKIGMNESDNKLHAVIFLSANDGKKINTEEKDSIEVLISPVTVKPQEHGYIKGYVRYISEYPSSYQGLMRILKNEMMVNQLSQNGAPFEMYVNFEINTSNKNNKFYWTSGDGPKMNIYAGTPCFALTTIMEQRPITLVLPALKDIFKIY
jgi:HlyD family secretion protein